MLLSLAWRWASARARRIAGRKKANSSAKRARTSSSWNRVTPGRVRVMGASSEVVGVDVLAAGGGRQRLDHLERDCIFQDAGAAVGEADADPAVQAPQRRQAAEAGAADVGPLVVELARGRKSALEEAAVHPAAAA